MRFAIVCLLAACATDADPSTNQHENTLIVPVEGNWHYAEVTPISSNCAAGDNGTNGGFVIDAASTAGFTVIEGSTSPFQCSLSGSSFHCPDRAWYSEDLRPDIDAVLTAHATAQGTFSSDSRATGTQDATVTCSGTACSLAGTWPCNFKVSFDVRAN